MSEEEFKSRFESAEKANSESIEQGLQEFERLLNDLRPKQTEARMSV